MGFLSSLFGWGQGGQRFVSESAFKENLANQTAMSPQTLEQLRSLNVTDSTQLKLEFFFYTDTKEKAAQLSQALKDLGYSVEHGPSEGNKDVLVITGWTTKMPMTESTVVAWTRKMCQVGFENDCEFDGWGTDPEQD